MSYRNMDADDKNTPNLMLFLIQIRGHHDIIAILAYSELELSAIMELSKNVHREENTITMATCM